MPTVFDHLSRQLSGDERQSMLEKIGRSSRPDEKPMHSEAPSAGEDIRLDQEFEELSFITRIGIRILGFLSGRGRNNVTQSYLIQRIQRRVNRGAPGLIDFRRRSASPKLFRYIADLRAAMDVFRRPLIRCLEEHKPDFYALLGKIEFEDIHRRLEDEASPELTAANRPGAKPSEIKSRLELMIDDIMNDITPRQRRLMLAHTSVLARMKTLVRYPYDRVLGLFPPGDRGAGGPASLRLLKVPLLELGDELQAFDSPPSARLLNTMFLFDLQDALDASSDSVEDELSLRMDRAAESLDTVRRINNEIPWMDLLKVLSENINYGPNPSPGGEDWLHVFKRFWRDRIARKYRAWLEKTRADELLENLKGLWGVDACRPIPGYRQTDFPEDIHPRHEQSFAAVRTLFLDVFPGRLYHTLNQIMMDGKFYKKDNRREYEEVYSSFLKAPDKVRTFELKAGPSGEFGVAGAEILRTAGETVHIDYRNLVRRMDSECLNLLRPLVKDMEIMSRLLKGVIDGDGGTYDTISNMAEIGGRGSKVFLRAIGLVWTIVDKSADSLENLMKLEEKRRMD